MKILRFVGAFIFFASSALRADPLPLGTIEVVQQVQGVTLTIPVNSTLDVQTTNNGITIGVALDANLASVQSNFPVLMKTFDLPSNNCDGYGQSVVAKLNSSSLTAAGNQAVIKANAHVAVWDCQKGLPGGGTTLEWKLKCWRVIGKKICTKVPQKITIQPGSDIKNRLVEDDVTAKVALLVSSKDGVSFEISPTDVNVELHNDITKFLNKIAAMFNVSATDFAKKSLGAAVNAGMLRKTIPEEFLQYNPKITSLSFYTRADGSLGMKVSLVSELTGPQLNVFIKEMLMPVAAQPSAGAEGSTGTSTVPRESVTPVPPPSSPSTQ